MVGWRHEADYGANTLYRDGHVVLLKPKFAKRPQDVLHNTVDTSTTFTWLPGERNTRLDYDNYRGEVEGWKVPQVPAPRFPAYLSENNKYAVDENDVRLDFVPAAFPQELSTNWRTFYRAWKKLPADPEHRQ